MPAKIVFIFILMLAFTRCASVTAPESSLYDPRGMSAAQSGRDHSAHHRHGRAIAGEVVATEQAINAACDKMGWSEKVTPAQQLVINDIFANPGHRVQHALWHAVRGGLENAEKQQVIATFGKLWGENQALCPPPQNNANSSSYNSSGEDFLYMHHEMVLLLRESLVASGLKCIRGWNRVPDPSQWPLPDPNDLGAKSLSALAKMRSWESFVIDPAWLRTISLSQLGWAVEFTIHNNLHMRYSTLRPPEEFRAEDPSSDGASFPLSGNFPPGWKFDDSRYNWLADPYGAALNPLFWKIHGYVDNTITQWLAANGKSRIDTDCGSDSSCYQWRGVWIGAMPEFNDPASDVPETTFGGGAKSRSLEKPVNAKATLSFTRKRLAHQRLGVIEEIPTSGDRDMPNLGGPSQDFEAPQDPVSAAASRVCPQK